MVKKQHFIRTTDKATADALRAEGYVELAKEGNTYVFLNDFDKNFSEDTIDMKKVNISNKICI